MSAAPAVEATDPSTPTWTASVVARRLGVAPATLRSWGVRYGIGPPDHQPGRYRRYSSTDIAELDTMCRLSRDGMPLATAASIARSRHRLSAPSTGGTGSAELVTLLGAVRRLDADTAVQILQGSLARHGVVDTWEHLCRPALRSTGLTDPAPTDSNPSGGGRGGAGVPADREPTACVDAECVLVWAITTGLRRLPPPTPAPPDADWALLACAEGEQHCLGTDVLLAALHERRIPARTLGPSVPTPALVHAAEHTSPVAMFIWAQTTRTAEPTILAALQARTRSLFAAGPGWSIGELPVGVSVIPDLAAAIRCAETTTRS